MEALGLAATDANGPVAREVFTARPGRLYLYQVYDKERPVLAVRLPAAIEQRLEALAAATGRTKSFYARKAIVDFMDDLEDIYLAESRLEAVRANRSRTFTLDEVEQELGLDR